MKKMCALLLSLFLVIGVAASPVCGAGGKVQGENAASDSFGGANGKGKSPGNNAQGNQA